MRIFEQRDWADGDVITPEEMNLEFSTLFGGLNGTLDRDNVQVVALIDRTKMELGSISKSLKKESAVSAFLIRSGGTDRQTWYDVPTLTGTIVTGDTTLAISAQLDAKSFANVSPTGTGGTDANFGWDLGVMVDNHLIGRTDATGVQFRKCHAIEVTAPVAAGSHTVKAVVRIGIGVGGGAAFTGNINLECRGRILLVRPRVR